MGGFGLTGQAAHRVHRDRTDLHQCIIQLSLKVVTLASAPAWSMLAPRDRHAPPVPAACQSQRGFLLDKAR